MSASLLSEPVSSSQIFSTGYATIAIATVFTIARFAIRWSRRKLEFQIEDGICIFSWVSFLVMVILYLVVTPVLYRVYGAAASGNIYPDLGKDSVFIAEIFFTNTMMFWIVLWSVKMSLLFLYRRLFVGLPEQMRWWWATLVFTVLMFIGCIISNFTSCENMHAWFTEEGCLSHRDAVAQVTSLYFAFAVDVITDIMIMLLPWKLLYLLHLPLTEKLALGGVFCVGLVCIAMAIVRVVQVGSQSQSDSTPSSTWLMFWAMIEAAIAVVVGTLPAFAIFFRRQQTSRRYASYLGSSGQSGHSHGIPLSDNATGSGRTLYRNPQKIKLSGINVTRTLSVTRHSNDMDMDEDPLHNSYGR